MAIEPARFVDDPGMLFVGIRRVHSYQGAALSIPHQWREFQSQVTTIPGRVGDDTYGVMCANFEEKQSFEYMTAVRVEALDAATTGLGRMRVKPQRYAVFVHPGHVSEIQRTWMAIWNDWIPRSGLRGVDAPEFEVYSKDFNPLVGRGGIEIWCAVAERV